MDINKAIRSAFEHYQTGNLELAERFCKKILKKHPDNLDVIYFLGIVYYQRQNYASAKQYIEKFLKSNPANSEAHYNLGRIFEKEGEIGAAISCYQEALKYNPHFSDAAINLGNLLQAKGQSDTAIEYYRKAIEADPKFAGAYFNLGILLQEKDHLDEAVAAYQKAIELNPNYADAYNNLGYALHGTRRIEEAIISYQKAIHLNPALFDAHNNLGRSFQELGQIEEAIESYQKAIQLNPEFADAHVNLAFALLLAGQFEEGWKEYEWRWKLKNRSRYDFPQPVWEGADLSGRTILLYAEQGFGDTILFIRYASLVATRGAKVIVECQNELKSLMSRVEGVKQIITHDDKLPEFDTHCPLLSLPMVFETELTNIPADIPYINADPRICRKWREKLQTDTSIQKIGLVWSGNPNFKRDRLRSCDLIVFAPLAEIQGASYYSLQKGEAAQQIKNPPEGLKIIDLTADINDFEDTAGLIENLDLVISVDTSVAHLVGALGKPVWTLVPFAPDWRWLLDRSDSPWYPTMRIFRQPSPGDWMAVIKEIFAELIKLAKDF